jgi:hypothetical protein
MLHKMVSCCFNRPDLLYRLDENTGNEELDDRAERNEGNGANIA